MIAIDYNLLRLLCSVGVLILYGFRLNCFKFFCCSVCFVSSCVPISFVVTCDFLFTFATLLLIDFVDVHQMIVDL